MHKIQINKFIENSLKEDIGDGDHTSIATINNNTKKKAILLVKNDGIIAGIELAEKIFNRIDPSLKIEKKLKDGLKVKKGDIAFKIIGNAHSILKSERLVLNCMQRMSAIATKTYQICKIIEGSKTKILDTRKTTPLNRFIEKWAVRIGGGTNHRFGLYDVIMIKDNHIDFAGGIEQAIKKTKEYLKRKKKNLKIIIEVRNIIELEEVLKCGGIDRILLDNFDVSTTKMAVDLINNKYKIESSGGITENTIKEYANCNVDYISLGELTNSIKNFDLSLKAI